MNLKLLLSIVGLLSFTVSLTAQEADWLVKIKGVRLLSHKREDIVKLLGNPSADTKNGYIWSYEINGGELDITFASGRCISSPDIDNRRVGWKVPEWTVTEVAFSPAKRIDARKLGLDFTAFRTTPIHDEPSRGIEYFNEDLGVYYIVDGRGRVEDVIFVPPKRLHDQRCS